MQTLLLFPPSFSFVLFLFLNSLFLTIPQAKAQNEERPPHFKVLYHWSEEPFNASLLEDGYLNERNFAHHRTNVYHLAGPGLYVSESLHAHALSEKRNDLIELWIPQKRLEKAMSKNEIFSYTNTSTAVSVDWVIKRPEGVLVRPFFGVQYSDEELIEVIKKITDAGIRKKYANVLAKRQTHFLWAHFSKSKFCFEKNNKTGTLLFEGNLYALIPEDFCPQKSAIKEILLSEKDMKRALTAQAIDLTLRFENDQNFSCRNNPQALLSTIEEELSKIQKMAKGKDLSLEQMAQELLEALKTRDEMRKAIISLREKQTAIQLENEREGLRKEIPAQIENRRREMDHVFRKKKNSLIQGRPKESWSEELEKRVKALEEIHDKELKNFEKRLNKNIEWGLQAKSRNILTPRKVDPVLLGFFHENGLNYLRHGDESTRIQAMKKGLLALQGEIENLHKEWALLNSKDTSSSGKPVPSSFLNIDSEEDLKTPSAVVFYIKNHLSDEERQGLYHMMGGDFSLEAKALQRKNTGTLMALQNYFSHLKSLFQAVNLSGSSDSIESHSLAVMNEFFLSAQAYSLDKIKSYPGIRNLAALLRLTLALHDIGKPVAGSTHQHENTIPILKHVFRQMEMTPQETQLAISLVGHDLLGRFVVSGGEGNPEMSLEKTFEGLKKLSQSAQMDLKDFFQLQKAFYFSDASYYKGIATTFSRKENGEYIINPKTQKGKALAWKKLEELIQKEAEK